ncbi:MAG: hypothetical protein IPI66_10695 [Chitinophagaceae bacterium]|nr:hypothetical protein [Chitinophagaceae bacterium]MBL0055342.1 hypothetical protein [Chitinophagaceae bacterium]
MDTTTLPEIIIPELKTDMETLLQDPKNIRLKEDINDPDAFIDELIARFRADGDDAIWLDKVKAFDHNGKVEWILSLPEPQREIPCMGYVMIVVIYITLMVMVGLSAAGIPIYEEKKVPKKVEKCVPKKP